MSDTNDETLLTAEKTKSRSQIALWVVTIVKIVVVLGLIGYASGMNGWEWPFFFESLAEAILIYLFSQLFVWKPKAPRIVGYILSSLLFFFFLINVGCKMFAGSFVTYIMWSNLANWSALGPAVPGYIAAIVGGLVIAFLPMKSVRLHLSLRNTFIAKIVDFVVIVVAYALIITFDVQTPLTGWGSLASEAYDAQAQSSQLESVPLSAKDKTYLKFERDSVPSGTDTGLKNPNVIVIFTEGFSSEIMDVNNGNRYPGLTPNLDAFSKQTVNFTDYFNQTAATGRAVRGQLFSSQQFEEGYTDGVAGIKSQTTTKLISLQRILGKKGYNTEFINPEPQQEAWTTYIDQLGFQKVVTEPADELTFTDTENVVSDQDNYQMLFDQANSLNDAGKPFMLATYTFETHVSADVGTHVYGDGSNIYLNKFHNVDDAFGKFWKQFEASPLAKNTIVVFTADHATFPDSTYDPTFGTKRDYFISPIPLMIYYPDVKPRSIDVGGKNSLSLAPTILDLMGDEKVKNYFLGNSLFSSQTSQLQDVTAVGNDFYWTKDATEKQTQESKDLTLNNPALEDEVKEYYSISLNY